MIHSELALLSRQKVLIALCKLLHSTVVPLLRDHKMSPQKRSLKRGLPYLVGNQELTPKALVPDYPPNNAKLQTPFERLFLR